MRNRVEVMHGVNLDTLGRRDPEQYGTITLPELEREIKRFAQGLELEVRFFQTNHEGEFVEHLHRLPEIADAALLNPGSWTHYSYAIRDALETARLPAIEVHISDVQSREEWRRHSVFEGLVIGAVSGKGPDGYREALEMLKQALGVSSSSRAERLAALLAERELDQLLVGDLVRPGDSAPDAISNLRWLTGFSGTSGLAIVGAEERAVLDRLPLPGARPARGGGGVRARHGASASCSTPRRSALRGRVGYDDAHTSVKNLRKLERARTRGRGAGGDRGPGGAPSPPQGRRRAAGDRRGRPAHRRGLRLPLRSGRGGEDRAPDHARRPSADAGAGRRRPLVSGDRRRRREQRPTAPQLFRAAGGRRRAAADRHGRDRRRLLLRLHAHGRRRRDRRRGARGLRAGALGPGDGAGGDPRGRRVRATPIPPPAIQSPRRGTASTSATGSGTGWGSRSTRRRACPRGRIRRSRSGTWSRSSRASTCRAASASGSRTWWPSPRTAAATSAASRRTCGWSR